MSDDAIKRAAEVAVRYTFRRPRPHTLDGDNRLVRDAVAHALATVSADPGPSIGAQRTIDALTIACYVANPDERSRLCHEALREYGRRAKPDSELAMDEVSNAAADVASYTFKTGEREFEWLRDALVAFAEAILKAESARGGDDDA